MDIFAKFSAYIKNSRPEANEGKNKNKTQQQLIGLSLQKAKGNKNPGNRLNCYEDSKHQGMWEVQVSL